MAEVTVYFGQHWPPPTDPASVRLESSFELQNDGMASYSIKINYRDGTHVGLGGLLKANTAEEATHSILYKTINLLADQLARFAPKERL